MAAQNSAMIEITFDTRQTRLRFARLIQARQNNLQDAFRYISVTLGHRQHRALKEIEKLVIPKRGDRQVR